MNECQLEHGCCNRSNKYSEFRPDFNVSKTPGPSKSIASLLGANTCAAAQAKNRICQSVVYNRLGKSTGWRLPNILHVQPYPKTDQCKGSLREWASSFRGLELDRTRNAKS